MGYTVRTPRYRFTEWRKWLGSAGDLLADWSDLGLNASELYVHDPDEIGNAVFNENVNVAEEAEYASTRQKLHALLVQHFNRTYPTPSPPSPGPAPTPSPSDHFYRCEAERCVEMLHPKGSSADPKCGGACSPLAATEWLAVRGASVLSNGNRTLTVKMPSTKKQNATYLKKSEKPAAQLPAQMKHEVQDGSVLNLARPAAVLDGVYYLIGLGPEEF
jgi:hypothetical protein